MKKTFTILLILYSLVLSAKNFDILNLTNSDGLSNSSINKIFQDTNGLIWFGTWDGLNVYNGRDLKTFKPEPGNSNSISNNIIRDIIEDNKNVLWITTDRGINRFDKTTNKFNRFFTDSNSWNIYSENSFFVTKNSYNLVFACVFEQGIHYFNNTTQRFVKLNVANKIRVRKVFFDLDYNLWLLTTEKKLFKVVFKKGNLQIPIIENIVQFNHLQNIESVFYNTNNELWLQTTDEKLYQYRISEGVLTDYSAGSVSKGIIKTLIFQNETQLWGTSNGLFRFNTITRKIEQLFDNVSVLSLFAGSQSIIWVGTDAQGVLQLFPLREKFQAYNQKNLPTFGRSAVRTFYEDMYGTLWVGTKGNGVYGLQAQKNEKNLVLKYQLTTQNGLSSNSVFTIVQGQGNEFWIGTDGSGISYFEQNSKTLNSLLVDKLFKDKLNLSSVYSILFTDNNIMWVGTSGNGMYKLEIDKNTKPYSVKTYKKYVFKNNQPTSLSNNIVYSIIKADNNCLWVGTRGGGLNLFDVKQEKFATYRFSENNPDLISSDDILALHKDKKGVLWIGTSMGLIKLLRIENGKPIFTRFTEKEGMPNNTIHGILDDKNNNLWLSTNKGLAKLVQQKSDVRIVSYFEKDGLQNNEFSDGAFYESPHQRTFYFGGISGFNVFNPVEISNIQYMPSLVLDAFYVDNTEKILPDFLTEYSGKQSLEISYKIKSFSFKFIPIDYISSTKCEISYLLEGYQKEWINLGTSNTIVFSNLPKGNYTLKVRCTNADKIWSDKIYSLSIIVQPPWWANNVAYICYFILLILIGYGLNRLTINQLKARNEIKMKELEKQKTEEIHQAKLRFFTNIAHEFSNSLTLIYGPSIQLLKNLSFDNSNRKYVNTIKTNSERMQNLIQQLIDFRKAETGYLKLNIERVDIAELVKFVTDNFVEAIENKKINLELSFTPTTIYWHTDWDCIEKIIFNLISNAVKYTPQGGKIDLNVETKNNLLYIRVKNYGIGIKNENRQSIFNRFEILNRFELQVSKGFETRNGIGLALCKNISEVLNGSIEVDSDGETYTSFVVAIPESAFIDTSRSPILASNQLEYGADELNIENSNKNKTSSIPDEKKNGLILVIDDEVDIRKLLNDFLSDKYIIAEAGNGKEAIEMMKVRMPILIVCDVIMPEMNGIEFVKIMKNQELTRHIPIILLSSKAAIENQIEGLELGADAYLGKPFHPRHLEAMIESLLKRNKAVLDFSESAYASMEQFEGKLIKKEDNELILKITKLVIEHLDDENLSLDSIAAEMAISKMQLYRKIKELIDQTPTEFIRTIRLNNAEKLLKTTNKTVQEIMYDCGFNNKTYFYREFAKKFQQTPKEYRNQK